MTSRCLILCLLTFALMSVALPADEVYLVDGKKFNGEITREDRDVVSIRTIGGVLTFPRSKVVRVVHKVDPRKVYGPKAEALARKEIAALLDLGKWCTEQNLPVQARKHLEQVLHIDPQQEDALRYISRLAGPRRHIKAPDVDITLTDNSRIKGRLINSTITLESLYGTLRIPVEQITAIHINKDGLDTVETQSFKAQGELRDQTFIIDSKLGRLSVSKKDVKAFAVRELTPAQLAEAQFQAAMRRLDRTGLDVMIVMDTTDTMRGTLMSLQADAQTLWDFLHKQVPNTTVGIVAYRDTRKNNPDDWEYLVKAHPLTGEAKVFVESVKALEAKGGGDIPEAVYDGLAEAMDKAGWRADSSRVIILIGDAPPRMENNGQAKTVALARDWNRRTGGVIHAIDTTGWNKLMGEFRQIAEATGGRALPLNDEKALVRTLIPLILGETWQQRLLNEFDGKPLDLDANPPAPAPAPDAPPPAADDGGIMTIEK